jgi:hypothetical protein
VSTPNVLVALNTSAELKDNIKYTQKGVVTEQLLAELFGFGVERVLVPREVLLCYAPKKPSILAPSAGYIFAWKGYFEASRF